MTSSYQQLDSGWDFLFYTGKKRVQRSHPFLRPCRQRRRRSGKHHPSAKTTNLWIVLKDSQCIKLRFYINLSCHTNANTLSDQKVTEKWGSHKSVPYLKRPANFEDQSGGLRWDRPPPPPPPWPWARAWPDGVSLLQQLEGTTGRTLHKLPAFVGSRAHD